MRSIAWVAVTAFVVVAVGGVLSVSTPAGAAGSAPVTIVNPLPVPVAVTGQVNGSVSATQSGSWSVGQSGPWTVGIDGVVPVSGAVPQPFQVSSYYDDWEDGKEYRTFTVNAPAGKILVVEHVSFRASVPSGQLVRAELACQGVTNGGLSGAYVPMEFQGAFDGESLFVASAPTRCYARGAQGLLASLSRSWPDQTAWWSGVEWAWWPSGLYRFGSSPASRSRRTTSR